MNCRAVSMQFAESVSPRTISQFWRLCLMTSQQGMSTCRTLKCWSSKCGEEGWTEVIARGCEYVVWLIWWISQVLGSFDISGWNYVGVPAIRPNSAWHIFILGSRILIYLHYVYDSQFCMLGLLWGNTFLTFSILICTFFLMPLIQSHARNTFGK